jgi:RNA polymerase sigma factor (sigma-70 family)
MSDAKATCEGVISLEMELHSLLPQIRVMTNWACHHFHHFPDQNVINDLVQEIILSLIRNDALSSFEHRSTEKTWLRVIVLHHVGRYFKSQKLTESLEDLPINLLPLQLPPQENEVFFKELRELVKRAQDYLTEREHELWLFLCDELSDREIADQMNIKIRTVQRNKCALRKKVKDIVERSAAELQGG